MPKGGCSIDGCGFTFMGVAIAGVLDAGEIRETLKKLGLKISDGQVKQLLHK